MHIPESAKPGAILGLFAAGGAALLAVTWQFTSDRIALEDRRARQEALFEIVPRSSHTNDMLEDTIQVSAPGALGTPAAVTVHRARRDGQPHAVVMEVVAPNGYGGPIRMLVGIRHDGTLAGVRIVSHKETPGLGDKIELGKSDWIEQFAGLSLGDPPEGEWAVTEDGGAFDSFTGATITPRAVVRAIRDALLYFADHREELFARENDADTTQPNPG